uniref:Uncharacterized protein n=1 Tax=Octopus bimaculoides TaxID=37653 RepID=A0A0L8FTG8_OCTBM
MGIHLRLTILSVALEIVYYSLIQNLLKRFFKFLSSISQIFNIIIFHASLFLNLSILNIKYFQ